MTKLIAAVVALAVAVPALAAEVNLFIWSEYIDPELVTKFEEQTGHKVNISLFEATEEMMAKLQAAGGAAQYDIVVAPNESIKALVELKLIQKVDRAKLPNLAGVKPQFKSPGYDPAGEYSVPYQWGTVGVMWNSKNVQLESPISWSVVLGENPPAKFVLIDTLRDQLGAALKFRGHGASTTDADEIRDAGKLVLAAKKQDNCVGFDGSVGGKNKVLAGNADVAVVYNGEALRAQEENEAMAFEVPKEGSMLWVDLMVLTAGSRNAEAAHQFMNFILDPANNAQLSNFNLFATPIEAAMPLIDEETRTNPAIYPPAEVLERMEFLQDVGDATRLYDQVWTAVKSR